MKNLRLVLVFYITLLSSFQLSNSLFQPQFSFPSHDSANPIKTLIGNLSHVLGMASRERNIRKCKMVFLMFLSQKGIFTLCIPRKILLPFPVFFSYFPHVCSPKAVKMDITRAPHFSRISRCIFSI